MSGPISPDGRHQWDGEKWNPIPPPPKAKMTTHNYFQIALIVLVAFVVIALLASAIS